MAVRFEDYAALARAALMKDNERVVESVRICAAREEAAKNRRNAVVLNDLISRHGGCAISPNLPMIRHLSPRFRLEDLVLPDEFIRIAESIRLEREKRDLLAKHNLEPKSRILCAGNPGTGKTAFAHALADHLDLPLYAVSWSQVITQYLGATSKLVDEMMDWISGVDCVFLMDEIDIILRERDDRNEIGEIKRIVCNLLPRLENMGSRAVIVAATNHPQCLDSAVWRRFQEILEFPDAAYPSRIDALRNFCHKHGIKYEERSDRRVCEKSLNFGDFERLMENALRESLIRGGDFFEILNAGGQVEVS